MCFILPITKKMTIKPLCYNFIDIFSIGFYISSSILKQCFCKKKKEKFKQMKERKERDICNDNMINILRDFPLSAGFFLFTP